MVYTVQYTHRHTTFKMLATFKEQRIQTRDLLNSKLLFFICLFDDVHLKCDIFSFMLRANSSLLRPSVRSSYYYYFLSHLEFY